MLCFLTENQEKKINHGIHEYTEKDILELAGLSSSIEALCYVMTMFYLDQENRQEFSGREITIFEILSLLIKPIDDFLSESAPMKEKE